MKKDRINNLIWIFPRSQWETIFKCPQERIWDMFTLNQWRNPIFWCSCNWACCSMGRHHKVLKDSALIPSSMSILCMYSFACRERPPSLKWIEYVSVEALYVYWASHIFKESLAGGDSCFSKCVWNKLRKCIYVSMYMFTYLV